MTESRAEDADAADVHRLLLPAARRLCADGSACVLRRDDQPLLLLATSGPEPRATRLVAPLEGAGESLTPLFLGRC